MPLATRCAHVRPSSDVALLVALLGAVAVALSGLAQAQSTPPAPGGQSPAPAAKAAEPQQSSLSDDQSAIDAARKWLELVDTGKTAPLWDNAAKQLKSTVTRQNWVSGMRDMRKPFGKLVSRKSVKFARAHELPDAPNADYAIIEFESQFANGKRADEQVIWMLEPDGVWRVSGYYIR